MAEAIDVIEVLTGDHREFNRLLDDLDGETRPAELRRILSELVEEVARHETAEENVVFPALMGLSPEVARHANGFFDEHREINELLAGMSGLNPAGAAFEKRAAAVVLQVRAHFTAEEETVFPQLKAGLTVEQRIVLGEGALSAKLGSPAFAAPLPEVLPY
jgi:hemerythrin superfamily protein